MKKQIVALITALVVLIASFSMMVVTVGAENAQAATSATTNDTSTARKFNVVLVVDASNSMNSTDTEGWRFEAIDQFLSLLSMKGNHIGTVVFNDKVLSANGMNAVTSKNDKQSASDAVKSVNAIGFTNIGAAIAKANELLKKGDPALPSIILLLSDGNTEMPTEAEQKVAVTAQKNAIAEAKNNDTAIYCVGLNANGKIDPTELSEIASQTNGVFKIVSKPDDLKDVFKEFYKLIYGTGGSEIQNVALPAVKEFNVPKIGVEEVNILIDGQPSSIKLTQPSGIEVPQSELGNMTTKGAHFTNIKIEKPLSGNWKIELNGEPGQTVTINFIPNLNVSLATQAPDVESFKRGETVSIVSNIMSEGNSVSDATVYQEYPATYTITNATDTSDVKTVDAPALESSYKADVTFDNIGTYYVTASIDIGYGKITGNTITINVGNAAPRMVEDFYEITEYSMSFGEKSFTYDLSEMVIDEDGEELSFVIDKAFFDVDEYSLDGATLTVTPNAAKEGSFTFIATDASGASCELQINIVYKNLLTLLIAIIAIVVIVGAILFFVINYTSTHKPYNGSITVVAYDEDNGDISAPMTEWPPKRPLDIEMINGDAFTIGGIKGMFFGSGKEYVNFKLKGVGYYNGLKVKKVKINDGCTERIASRQDGTKGVEITFTKQDGGF